MSHRFDEPESNQPPRGLPSSDDGNPTSDEAAVTGARRPPTAAEQREAACLRAASNFTVTGLPAVPPIVPAAVWECESTEHADALLSHAAPGYVYQRDGHPNADWLAEHIRLLHGAENAAVTSSGMAALSAWLLAHAKTGDRLFVSSQLYGRSLLLLDQEARRWGLEPIIVDVTDPAARQAAWARRPALAVVETIANPCLRVADVPRLAEEAHAVGARLLVDNTFATPLVCQPLGWGADEVLESLSKLMNGHGDLMLGALAGRGDHWDRIEQTISTWGLASGPWEAWLAQRGLGTLGLRVARACRTASELAIASTRHPAIARVDFPGLAQHPDHELACRLFSTDDQGNTLFGHVVTVHLKGGRAAADRLIAESSHFPFCPSLGELRTTLSHPQSTSHRGLTEPARESLGIGGGTVRISVGIEPTAWVLDGWLAGLDRLPTN